MPIPAFTTDGFLPEGVHACTLAEACDRFGQFQRTDRRCRLCDRLQEYVRAAQASGVVRSVIVDGSFTTLKDSPGDIDLIVVALPEDELPADLRPAEYNALSSRNIRRQFGLDVLVAQEGQVEVDEYVEFFSQVRDRPNLRKGMLRIVL